MTTALITHPDCLGHLNPPGHPERVERLRAILAALEAEPFANLVRVEAPLASDAEIRRAHPAEHLARLAAAAPEAGFAAIDADTFLSPGTLARGAAGGGGGGARRRHGDGGGGEERLLRGAAARAPCRDGDGHGLLLLRQRGGGRAACAGGARARAGGDRGFRRAPWQRHAGPGVGGQAGSASPRPHQMPLYPGTGAREETGAFGQIVNVPLPPGASGGVFRAGMLSRVLPAVEAHGPEMILVSAGFDAHARDPLGQPAAHRGGLRLGDGAALRAGQPLLRGQDRLDSRGRI